jgi:DNA helicase-2/ATP-dependent DNA helicase PcrA
VRQGATRPTTGKPANIQAIARQLIADPSHAGVAAALGLVRGFVDGKAAGFDTVKIDLRSEFMDAARIGEFAGPDEAFAEIARRRSYARPSPPKRVLSSIHKAKGLECDNVLLIACDKAQFTTTSYAKCKLYVALSRAKRSLALVVPESNPSPLVKIT